MEKVCSKCGAAKSLDEFYSDAQKKDGRSSACKPCVRAAQNSSPNRASSSKAWRLANPEKVSALKRAAYARSPEKHRAARLQSYRLHREARQQDMRNDYQRNKAARLAYSKGYVAKRPEVARKAKAAWKSRNPDALRADRAKRRSAEQMPPWADKVTIRVLYRESRRLSLETGIKHHVDHIVPLRSPVVCGLHWEANLQILTADDNHRKNNKFVVQ